MCSRINACTRTMQQLARANRSLHVMCTRSTSRRAATAVRGARSGRGRRAHRSCRGRPFSGDTCGTLTSALPPKSLKLHQMVIYSGRRRKTRDCPMRAVYETPLIAGSGCWSRSLRSLALVSVSLLAWRCKTYRMTARRHGSPCLRRARAAAGRSSVAPFRFPQALRRS